MEINKDLINKLSRLDDNDLSEIIRAVASAAGVDERRAEHVAKNPGNIRRKIGKMTEEDLLQLAQSVGEEKAKDILSKLQL